MSKNKKIINRKICLTSKLRRELILKHKNERDIPATIAVYAQIIYLASVCKCNTVYCIAYNHPLRINNFKRAIKKALHTIEYGN